MQPQRPIVEEIQAERNRQITVEKFNTYNDDCHTSGQLAQAAACYAAHAARPAPSKQTNIHEQLWPWSYRWWKPTSPRRDLIKAAALIVAEIERLDRKAVEAAWTVVNTQAPAQILEIEIGEGQHMIKNNCAVQMRIKRNRSTGATSEVILDPGQRVTFP